MIFISKNEKGIPAWKLIIQGRKYVTRRLKPQPIGAIRAVCPGRGKKAVCYIKILSCMKYNEWIEHISEAEKMLFEIEANKEGFDSWDGLLDFFSGKKILIYKTYRIEFELVPTCSYPKCNKVAEVRLGIADPDAEMTPYCKKCAKKAKMNTIMASDTESPTIRTPKGGGHLPMVMAWSKTHRTGKTEADKRRYNFGKTEERIKIGECNVLNTGIGGSSQSTATFVNEKKSIRRLTPTECERLQGFPDGWTSEGTEGKISDSQRYKMLGNAVTTNVIEAIARGWFKNGSV